MNMKKYIALVLGIMMVAATLCGCGSDEKAKTDEKSEAGTTQVTETKKADDKEAAKEEDKKEDVTADEKVAETSPEKEEKKDSDTSNKENNSSEKIHPGMPEGTAGIADMENTKYGEDDVYTKANGVPAAKTESGTDVELTGETLQELMNEYGKVTGTGTPEEKELLEKIQVLLETMPYAQSAN